MPPSTTVNEQDEIAPGNPPIPTEGTRLAPDLADRGAGACADGDADRRPSDAAVRTVVSGGGTSGNHGNGTAG